MKNKRLHWAWHALLVFFGVIACGAVLGAVVFPLWGLVFGLDYSVLELTVKGVRTMGFYFFMWAPGMALVLGVKRAYEAKQAEEIAQKNLER